jgi:ribose-phosphate pyrophosphokinase
VGQARLRRFPDTEVSFQIDENIAGKDVFIVQPTCAGRSGSVDEHLLELLIMIDAFRRSSASRITAVLPYLRLRAAGSERQTARADFGQVGRQRVERGRHEPCADDGFAQGADPGVL